MSKEHAQTYRVLNAQRAEHAVVRRRQPRNCQMDQSQSLHNMWTMYHCTHHSRVKTPRELCWCWRCRYYIACAQHTLSTQETGIMTPAQRRKATSRISGACLCAECRVGITGPELGRSLQSTVISPEAYSTPYRNSELAIVRSSLFHIVV
jgi:hypothetical protein